MADNVPAENDFCNTWKYVFRKWKWIGVASSPGPRINQLLYRINGWYVFENDAESTVF